MSSSPIIISNSTTSRKKFKLSSLPRLLLRLTIYPAFTYVIFIYINEKFKDPNGFNKFKQLNLKDMWNGTIRDMPLKPEFTTEEIFREDSVKEDKEENIEDYKNEDYSSRDDLNLFDDIMDLRKKLINASIRCHRFEARLGLINLTSSQCNKNFFYHERIFDEKLERNANIYAVPILKAIQSIVSLNIKLKDYEFNKFIKKCGDLCKVNSTDLMENKIDPIYNDFERKIDHIKSKVFKKLNQDQELIISNFDNEPNFEFIPQNYEEIEKSHSNALQFINSNFNGLSKTSLNNLDQSLIEKFPSKLTTNLRKGI